MQYSRRRPFIHQAFFYGKLWLLSMLNHSKTVFPWVTVTCLASCKQKVWKHISISSFKRSLERFEDPKLRCNSKLETKQMMLWRIDRNNVLNISRVDHEKETRRVIFGTPESNHTLSQSYWICPCPFFMYKITRCRQQSIKSAVNAHKIAPIIAKIPRTSCLQLAHNYILKGCNSPSYDLFSDIYVHICNLHV